MENRSILRSSAVGPWQTNAYALVCPQSRKSALIDPGGDPDRLAAILADSQPEVILVTHSHPDHIGALSEMRQRLNAPVMAHAGKAANIETKPDRWIESGDHIIFGAQRLSVRHTPGHCDDQVCFIIENDSRVFVGDTIFEGGPGKTWSPSDFKTTLATLSNTVLTWSDDTICYPGHGTSFRFGDIREQIETFVRKDHGDFFGDATWGM